MKLGEVIFYAILLIICGLIIYLIASNKQDCEASGGHYVRGLYIYECIN